MVRSKRFRNGKHLLCFFILYNFLWIPIALAMKICSFRIVITCAKIPLYKEAPSISYRVIVVLTCIPISARNKCLFQNVEVAFMFATCKFVACGGGNKKASDHILQSLFCDKQYPQFSFWIATALAKICFFRIVINCAKVP